MLNYFGLRSIIGLWNILWVVFFCLHLNNDRIKLIDYHLPLFLGQAQTQLNQFLDNLLENIGLIKALSTALRPNLSTNYPFPYYKASLNEFRANLEFESAYPYLNGSLIGVGDPKTWDVEKQERLSNQLMLFAAFDKVADKYIPYDKGVAGFSYLSADQYVYFFNRNMIEAQYNRTSTQLIKERLKPPLRYETPEYARYHRLDQQITDQQSFDMTPTYYDQDLHQNVFSINYYAYDKFDQFSGIYAISLSVDYLESMIAQLRTGIYKNIGILQLENRKKAWHYTLFNSPQLPDSELLNRQVYSILPILNDNQLYHKNIDLKISYYLNKKEVATLFWFFYRYDLLTALFILLSGNILIITLYNRHQQFQERCKDDLTGAYSLFAFNRLVKPHAHKIQQQNRPVSIIMIDADKFKAINDNYGYDIGDLAMKHLVAEISKQISINDYLCRIGGDDFIVVAFDLGEAQTLQLIDCIRKAVAKPFTSIKGKYISLSVSCGFYTLHKAQSFEIGMKLADKALYRQKWGSKVHID